jgi:cysteine desulfurase
MSAPAEIVYLDNNATTNVAPEAVAAMVAAMTDAIGNPSSKHAAGERAKALVASARGEVARLLGASPAEIVLTSGGTEANHQAILGALALQPGRRHIVTSAVEHTSALALLRHLETQGVAVTTLCVDADGRLDPEAVANAIRPDTALVSLMWANNETGVLLPVAEAAAMARSRGVLVHSDAVQAAGKATIDLAQVPVDLLSISGHKFHAPSGIGALFVRKGLKLPALLHGSHERGRRGGTENVPGAVGLGRAAALARARLDDDRSRLEGLRDRLEKGIRERVPFATINGGAAPRVANTSSIRFGGLEAEVILAKLDRLGICASAGAACGAGSTEPSHVLTAMGLTPRAALASVRFSLSRHTTETEIDRLLAVLPPIVGEAAALAA